MEFNIETSMSLLVFLGVATPFFTAALTRLRDPDWFKGIFSLATAAVVGAVAAVQDAGLDTVAVHDILQHGVGVWTIHLMTYYGLTKEAVSKVAKATVSFAPVSLR